MKLIECAVVPSPTYLLIICLILFVREKELPLTGFSLQRAVAPRTRPGLTQSQVSQMGRRNPIARIITTSLQDLSYQETGVRRLHSCISNPGVPLRNVCNLITRLKSTLPLSPLTTTTTNYSQ